MLEAVARNMRMPFNNARYENAPGSQKLLHAAKSALGVERVSISASNDRFDQVLL